MKQTRGDAAAARSSTYRSRSGLSGSIEKPPPPIATMGPPAAVIEHPPRGIEVAAAGRDVRRRNLRSNRMVDHTSAASAALAGAPGRRGAAMADVVQIGLTVAG